MILCLSTLLRIQSAYYQISMRKSYVRHCSCEYHQLVVLSQFIEELYGTRADEVVPLLVFILFFFVTLEVDESFVQVQNQSVHFMGHI